MIVFGIALLVCHALAAPTTTLSPQAAVAKLQAIVANETETLWHSADTNKDGKFTAQDMSVIFTDYDTNKDGDVSKTEFIGRFTHNEPGLDTIARGLFLEFDVNRDDSITQDDLNKYYMRIDTDGDKNVDQTEFKTYFNKVLTLLFVIQIQQMNPTTTTSHP